MHPLGAGRSPTDELGKKRRMTQFILRPLIHIDKLNALYETYIDIANWGRILHQNVNKELSHMFVERLQLPPKERYEQFNRRYPRLINRVKLKYVAAFLGISIYTLSRVRAKK